MGESDHRAAEWIVKEDGNKWDTTITDLVKLTTQMWILSTESRCLKLIDVHLRDL